MPSKSYTLRLPVWRLLSDRNSNCTPHVPRADRSGPCLRCSRFVGAQDHIPRRSGNSQPFAIIRIPKGNHHEDHRKRLCCLSACVLLALCAALKGGRTPRIQRGSTGLFELLEQDQPIYYTGSMKGLREFWSKASRTPRPGLITSSYDMEHAPFDVKGLAEYMRGLAKGGRPRAGTALQP